MTVSQIRHCFRLAAVMMVLCRFGLSLEQPAPGAGGSPMPSTAVVESDADWHEKVVVVAVKGAIVGKPFSDMPETVTAALDKADRDGAHLVVLEIDSPGGEVGTCDSLSKRIFESKTPVVALVLHKAVSGGAMLASAAREIVMTRSARMGDIQPMQAAVTGSAPQMDERTAEKIEVDIRTIMKVYAEHYGRPVAVVEGMVSRASSVYQVTFRDGPIEYLTGHELELLEQNIEKGRDRREIADSKIIKPVGKLLELSGSQAVEYGIASEVVDSAEAFYASRGIRAEDVVRPDIEVGELDLKKLIPSVEDFGLPVWVIVLLGVFLVVGIAGLVTEYHAPGTGVPAAIGIIGFVCFFSTLLMHDRGSPVGIALFLVGIALLVVEIMVLPGFGVAGISGLVAILIGLLLAFTPSWDSEYMHTFMWHELGAFVLLLALGLAAAIAVIIAISEYGHRVPLLRRFFLTVESPAGDNPYPETMDEEPQESARLRIRTLIGQTGVAETMLRPAGKVRLVTGELLDVVTDGVYVEPGATVRVIEAAPNRIVVTAAR
ncbi:MAG: ATP-dependent Clp protease proteolytic subunit [Planctomycetes bacterium]|nr:ATP-dependent Clp protease proteolytic subunit [Planctomycetota bacterium]